MKVQSLSHSKKWGVFSVFCLLVVLAVTLCVCQQSRAAQSPATGALVDDPFNQIHWAAGPQRITLSDFAYIDIPQGYRMTDVIGARKFLESQNDTVPGDTVGILASTSGNWWAVLEYNTKGYVKDANLQQIDSAAVLKAVQAQIQAKDNAGSAVTSVSWDKTPVYDSQAQTLAWSLQVQNGSAKAVNQTIVLLGRYGVFQITAVQPSQVANVPSLADLASNISFKDGDRYADYQIGDKIADIGLAQLIAGEKHVPVAASSISGGTAMVYVYSALALCVVVGSVMLLRKKNQATQVSAPAAKAVSAAAPAQPQPAVAAAAVSSQPTVDANGTHANGMVAAKVATATNGSHGTKPLHRNRRKKVFNYPKFYTNVMRELSLHSYGPGPGQNGNKNGYANGRANGHANGNKNGHANGHTNGHANGNGSSANESLKSEIVELIATQKNLIQEQKTLLEEQTRLIEQKRWLIEEQTAFLKGQAENQFPLKFE